MDHCNLFLPFISNKGRVAFPLWFSKKRKKKCTAVNWQKVNPKLSGTVSFFGSLKFSPKPSKSNEGSVRAM